ncbi:MAG: hypothetical protein WCW54_03490 [Candidatus Paceibacterota bacterium]
MAKKKEATEKNLVEKIKKSPEEKKLNSRQILLSIDVPKEVNLGVYIIKNETRPFHS